MGNEKQEAVHILRQVGFACLILSTAIASPAQNLQTAPNATRFKPPVKVPAAAIGNRFGRPIRSSRNPGDATPGTGEIVLHNFIPNAHGAYTDAGVIRGPGGNLFGTAFSGGLSGYGVVYWVDTAGHQTVLYSFTGGADGAYPEAGLITGKGDNLYGTAIGGGASGAGVVFKLDTTGHETVLYSFTGGADGAGPEAGLIRDAAGNLYGTTAFGGAAGFGVVFKLDAARTETVLYSFTGGADGSNPEAGLIRDAAGNLYGTTTYGGSAGAGVVFKLDAARNETVIYSFTGGSDGGNPFAGVIRDAAGNLYGTTAGGGAAGFGIVFELDTAGNEKVLYSFTGGTDGGYCYAGLTRDPAGDLFGTTSGGGPAQAGVVFKVDTTGHETVLYGFAGTDGADPWARVIGDSTGNLYGTTQYGGAAGNGVVYKIDATGHETILHNFMGGADGAFPVAGVILDSAGNLYGTTNGGGEQNAGTVYELDANGNETVLYTFTGGTDGGGPNGGVILDPAGNLLGTTIGGGAFNAGTVYKVDRAGNETVLYSFTDGADGGFPYASLARDSAGNLYGTTSAGGTAKAGAVFKLDPTGLETVLYSFTEGLDGGEPFAGVILDSAGALYGTTWSGGPPNGNYPGVVFKVDPTTDQETVLYGFTGFTDGNSPRGGVIRDSAGNFYGATEGGGTTTCLYNVGLNGCGVVFKVDPTGHETVLYTFTGGSDGAIPEAGVTRDAAGNLYGTASSGGKAGAGVVFKLPGVAN